MFERDIVLAVPRCPLIKLNSANFSSDQSCSRFIAWLKSDLNSDIVRDFAVRNES